MTQNKDFVFLIKKLYLESFNKGGKYVLNEINNYVENEDENVKCLSYWLIADIYELGRFDITQNLEIAFEFYKKIAQINDFSSTKEMNFIARTLMRMGGENNFEEAKKWLEKSLSIKNTGDSLAGLGFYYEKKPKPNFNVAKKYYWKALCRLCFQGGFGLQRIFKKEGKVWKAYLIFSIHILFGAINALRLRFTKKQRFYWYLN